MCRNVVGSVPAVRTSAGVGAVTQEDFAAGIGSMDSAVDILLLSNLGRE